MNGNKQLTITTNIKKIITHIKHENNNWDNKKMEMETIIKTQQ